MIRFEIVTTLTVDEVEQDCAVKGHWSPSRPPPSSPGGFSHDDPRFADVGDFGECEVEEVRDQEGRIVPEEVWRGTIDRRSLYAEVAAQARDAAEAAAADAADAKFEQNREREMGRD